MASPPIFDVLQTYNRVLTEDPDITMPVAAIEALILGVLAIKSSTVSETLHVVRELTEKLKLHIPNAISLSAGTDLFEQYLITNLNQPTSTDDFDQIRTQLLQNGREIVQKSKIARARIARIGSACIIDDDVVLTNGGSRVVGAIMKTAAKARMGRRGVRFKVIYVVAPTTTSPEETAIIADLRQRGIPIATIPPTAVAYCINQVTKCFVGAEGIVECGGVVSRLGTFQMAMIASDSRIPFYVVSESHKFVRLFPMGQDDLGLEQKIVDFKVGPGVKKQEDEDSKDEGVADMDGTGERAEALRNMRYRSEEAVDYTPPDFISGVITESGVHLPSAVSEELIRVWF